MKVMLNLQLNQYALEIIEMTKRKKIFLSTHWDCFFADFILITTGGEFQGINIPTPPDTELFDPGCIAGISLTGHTNKHHIEILNLEHLRSLCKPTSTPVWKILFPEGPPV